MVAAADESTAIAVDVVPGNRHDARLLRPSLARAAQRVGAIDQVVGDRGFDGRDQRDACREVGAEPVIPYRRTATAPEPHDEAAYRERNRVERLFGRLKEFRRVATRYDKRKRMFLGWLHLTLGFIRLRSVFNVNTA